MPMAGFDRRQGGSIGVLDELYVSALALVSDAGEPFIMCCFDLLGTDRALCRQVRAAVNSRLTAADERIWVGATHTHSAPSGIFSGRANYCAAYTTRLAEQAACAAKRALASAEEASAYLALTEAEDIASLRDRPRESSGYRMPLLTLGFERPGRSILLCRFACHPTVLDERNRLYSRDLPGAIERALPRDTDCVFLNGACADLSTRYTRRSSDPAELERLGALAARAAEGAQRVPDAGFGRTIFAARSVLSAPRRGGLPECERLALHGEVLKMARECADLAEKRELESKLAVLERPPAEPEPDREVELTVADFGSIILIGLPFEVSSGDGAAIERELSAAAGRPVYAVCYTGGYDGYLPSGEPLSAASSYQDVASRYEPSLRARLLERARGCIGSLK